MLLSIRLLYIRFFSVGFILSRSSSIYRTLCELISELSLLTWVFTRRVSIAWSLPCKKRTRRLKNENMRPNMEKTDSKAQELSLRSPEWYEKVDRLICYESLPYILKVIKTQLIRWHYDHLVASYFGLKRLAGYGSENAIAKLFCMTLKLISKAMTCI